MSTAVGKTIFGTVDNGSQEYVKIPGVYDGVVGVTGRLRNNGIARQAGFFIPAHLKISADDMPQGTPITLNDEKYRVVDASVYPNGSSMFAKLNLQLDLEDRDGDPFARTLDTSTLEQIAVLISGADDRASKNRSNEQVTRFFAAAELPRFVFRKSDLHDWVLLCLKQCTPNEIVKVILRISSPFEYAGNNDALASTLARLNSILAVEGLRVSVDGVQPALASTDPFLSTATSAPSGNIYVSLELIASLHTLNLKSLDFSKLARLCEELNIAAAHDARMTIAMLVRAIMDHIPPAFGFLTFKEVCNNYQGTRSFKSHISQLDRSLRNIADGFLHTQIRKSESLPTSIEVDFRAPVNELIRELLRNRES